MNSFSNLYFNLILNEETRNNNGLTLQFSPLDALPTQSQTNTKRLSFKVLICGASNSNLQPMVCTVYFASI